MDLPTCDFLWGTKKQRDLYLGKKWKPLQGQSGKVKLALWLPCEKAVASHGLRMGQSLTVCAPFAALQDKRRSNQEGAGPQVAAVPAPAPQPPPRPPVQQPVRTQPQASANAAAPTTPTTVGSGGISA